MAVPVKRRSFMKSRWQYYRRLAALYRSYRRRDTTVDAPPLRLWLEISSRCNLRCGACPNKDLPPGQKGDMAWPLFQGTVDQAREFAFELNLHHRGESLLHPEAGRFIRYAVASGVHCRLHTNAVLLSGRLADDILGSGLGRLSVSLDGFSAEAYEANRVGASFATVTGNVADFLAARRRLGRKLPRVAIEVLDLPAAAGGPRRREFVERFRKLGLDELVVKKPHNWAGYLGGSGEATVAAACTFPWNALLVLFNGDVLACAQDFFAVRPLGNAAAKPLLEIWNGAPLHELRRAFAAGEAAALSPCSACDRIRRPTLGGVPGEFLRRLLLRRMN
jgi:hypothetical protein